MPNRPLACLSRRWALALCTTALTAVSAQAAVIDHADVGGFRTFQDTDTGRVWLDLNNFFGETTNQMIAQANAAGFTFVLRSDVDALLGSLPLTGCGHEHLGLSRRRRRSGTGNPCADAGRPCRAGCSGPPQETSGRLTRVAVTTKPRCCGAFSILAARFGAGLKGEAIGHGGWRRLDGAMTAVRRFRQAHPTAWGAPGKVERRLSVK